MNAADLVRNLAEADADAWRLPHDNEPAERADAVISARVRIARNLSGYCFPNRLGLAERRAVRSRIGHALREIRVEANDAVYNLSQFNQLQLSILQERKLSTLEHGRARAGSAIILDDTAQVVGQINEDDHLRFYALAKGNAPKDLYAAIVKPAEALAQLLPAATSAAGGYFCASPRNTGTGLRVSALMHLPALAMTDRLPPIENACTKLGFNVAQVAAEGDHVGHLYQIDSTRTEPGSEAEVVDEAQAHFAEITRLECEARQFLLESRPELVYDQVARAWALLQATRVIDVPEAVDHLMALRFGIQIGALPNLPMDVIDDLFVGIRPAHLQFLTGKPLTVFERDSERARLIQTRLAAANTP